MRIKEGDRFIFEIGEASPLEGYYRIKGTSNYFINKEFVEELESYDGSYGEGYQQGYQKGTAEAWDLARKITRDGLESGSCSHRIKKVFNVLLISEVFKTHTFKEAKEKYESYIKELNTIKIGDEIEYLEQDEEANKGDKGYIISKPNYDFYFVLTRNKPHCTAWFKKNFRKTGKHNSKLAKVIKEITDENT